MNSPSFSYTPHANATPESEAALLGNVFRYVLSIHESRCKQEAATARNRLDDARERSDDACARTEYTG